MDFSKSRATFVRSLFSLILTGLLSVQASAAVTFSTASTVTTPSRVMNFDNAFSYNTSNYSEDSIHAVYVPGATYGVRVFTAGEPVYGTVFPLNPNFAGRAAYFSADGRVPYAPLILRSSDGADVNFMDFNISSGYSEMHLYWESFLDGSLVGSGSFDSSTSQGWTFGFSGMFDEIRLGTYFAPLTTFNFQQQNGSAIFLDNVRMQVATVTPIPEPSSAVLVGLGLLVGFLKFSRRTI